MDAESYSFIRELKRKAPRNVALVISVSPNNTIGSNNYQVAACLSDSIPPRYRESMPHWEFDLYWLRETPLRVRKPDGSHTFVDDPKPLRSTHAFVDFILDTVVNNRIAEPTTQG
jgi:hypothetical protein